MRDLDGDPDTGTIVDAIAATRSTSIYDLSRVLKWSYGKTERKVKALLDAGKLHSTLTTRNNRTVRLLSVTPLEGTAHQVATGKEGKTADAPELRDAFKHLYGIFKELKNVSVDPTRGLISYCERENMDPATLIAMLDRAGKAAGTRT